MNRRLTSFNRALEFGIKTGGFTEVDALTVSWCLDWLVRR